MTTPFPAILYGQGFELILMAQDHIRRHARITFQHHKKLIARVIPELQVYKKQRKDEYPCGDEYKL